MFRVLAFLVALPAWVVSIHMITRLLQKGASQYTSWELAIGMLLGGLAFTMVAISGYMPKILFRLFGTVAGRDIR